MNTHAETLVSYGYDAASRLTNVVSGTWAAGYNYVPLSPLLAETVSHENGTARLTVARSYDYLNRLKQIGGTPGAPNQMPWSFNYSYDSANQRTNVAMADQSRWSYKYDNLGQVTDGNRFWGNSTAVAGQQFEYDFDTIGNRLASRRGGGHECASFARIGLHTETAEPI
jgi:YD repeat-containing protein